MESNLPNVDRATVDDFGREWQRFDQSGASSAEVQRMFGEYFAVFPWDSLPRNSVGFDAGCGRGGWAALVAPAGSTASMRAPTHWPSRKKGLAACPT